MIQYNQVPKIYSTSRCYEVQAVDTDDDKILVKEFLEISESSLNKIWLDPEEDEAWKDL
ncbi:hypothetical protein PN480_20305 [Dolichospermum circinale CS-1225]|uniref:Uncharacterized protein n=1 Tax=Dolichospermum circinale CS-537/01 TaxID=3021739 RepID=A0ABT5A4D9_9CYAN|nr:hypothetical protein [Dolichospermum circinale]MDB9484917.1 hypothetical protein [Dolichospermum circinale CS-537/05]MDB9466799.1 hypothetical protein [Dolichospermum circinale CS-539/09]MDB9472471.1 hypothetical protein [Dolichospermum circinale CS-539]MDB9474078.1 hypothetical protein [Dolichospermum circinale CS-537/11]MDB9479839.1 hypothetical protein [Dolichospermum circinale CS-537/03]